MRPRRTSEPGKVPAGLLAVLVHLAFLALLVFGVTWQTRKPAPVAVDLWSTLPAPPKLVVKEPAPQPKPEPPPEPRLEPKPEPAPEPKPAPVVEPEPPKPDIALKEKEEKLKREQEEQEAEARKVVAQKEAQAKKVAAEKAAQEKKAAAEKEAQAKKVAAEKEAQAKKLAAQKDADAKAKAAEQATANAKAQADAANAKVNNYIDQIAAKIRSNTIIPPDVVGNPQLIYEITLLPTGEVLNVRLIKPSGFPSYDAAAERAIYKSQPLPVPKGEDGALFASQFRVRNYVFRPEPNQN